MKDSNIVEREWTDRYGAHYEVKGIDRDGKIHTQRVLRCPHSGWSLERELAYGNVAASIATSTEEGGQ